MRRLGAAGIDFAINYIINLFVYCIFISIWKMLRSIQGPDMESYFILMVLILFFVAYIFTNMMYSVLFDILFQGHTIGKRILACNINVGAGSDRGEWKWIVKHALFRTMASLFYIITVLFYVITLRMPYDKALGTIVGAKKEKVNIKTAKGNKRLAAIIIDYFVMLIIYAFLMLVILFCYKNPSNALLLNILSTSMFCTLIYMFAYFFVMDYFLQGSSIGKRKVGIRLLANQRRFNILTSFIHSLLKTLACCIWPVSLIFFLSKGVMFYDKWIGLEVIDENSVELNNT